MALTTINSGGVKDDSIVNADIKSDAAIAGSKINPAFTTAASITAAQPQLQFQDSDGTNQITEVSNSSGHTYIKTRNNTGGGNFYVNTWDNANSNYPTLFTILNGGNVGIGTTSPTEKLHVIGQVGGTNPTAGSKWDIARFVAHDYSPTNSGGLTIGAYWNNSTVSERTSYIQSSQNTDSGSTVRALLLNPDGGKVGIGTTDPVSGDFVVENTGGTAGVALSRVFSGNVASSAVNTPSLAFTMSDTATNDQVVASINPQALAGTGDAFKGHMRIFTANDAGTNTERLRITSDGDIQFHRTAYEAGTVEQKINYYSDAGTAGSAVMGKNCEIAFVKKDSWSPTWTSYGEIVFRVNADSRYDLDEAARFNYSGNLAFPNGQGIDFSASEGGTGTSSEASLLKDYETGTWTPATGGSNWTATTAIYVKVGGLVTLFFDITNGTGANRTSIENLPFSVNASHAEWHIAYYAVGGSSTATTAQRHGGYVSTSGALITTAAGGTQAWDIATTDRIIGRATYYTTS